MIWRPQHESVAPDATPNPWSVAKPWQQKPQVAFRRAPDFVLVQVGKERRAAPRDEVRDLQCVGPPPGCFVERRLEQEILERTSLVPGRVQTLMEPPSIGFASCFRPFLNPVLDGPFVRLRKPFEHTDERLPILGIPRPVEIVDHNCRMLLWGIAVTSEPLDGELKPTQVEVTHSAALVTGELVPR